MRVAVVGSGLAAMAAASALAERGIHPVVLDVGRALDGRSAAAVARLAAMPPTEWTDHDRALFANPTLRARSKKPVKLAFGSDYFYGDPRRDLRVFADGHAPPFSHAVGGLSVGWGASVLPPHELDVADWPLRAAALAPWCEAVLRHLPYSARPDGLSRQFPILQEHPSALAPSAATSALLADLRRGLADVSSDDVVFGQARLLTRAEPGPDAAPACVRCGECMSGCVYGAIHGAAHTLARLKGRAAIVHETGIRVDSLREDDDAVVVFATRTDKSTASFTFDRVFLAAGALGSTAIVLRSKGLYERPVRLLSTGGFVMPLLRWRGPPSGWPHMNTQAGAFLEFRERHFSSHWVHTQLSTMNEMALSLVGAKAVAPGWLARVKRKLLEHTVVAHANFHSDHANAFVLALRPDGEAGGSDALQTRVEDRADVHRAHRIFQRALTRLLARCRAYAIPLATTHGTRGESFHIGGSLPMRAHPRDELETDLLGRPPGWRRVHVVDSSVFPSLPGTTIGLLAMANATRIVSEAPLTRAT